MMRMGRNSIRPASAHRGHRTSKCGKIDADQPDSWRGPAAHRAGSRDHPRRDLRRFRPGRPQAQDVRYGGPAPPRPCEDKLEKLAGADGLRAAIRRSGRAACRCDHPFEKQDLTLADLIIREGRALVIALNKWDLVEERGAKLRELREEAARLLPQVKGVPVVPVSGATGHGIPDLLETILRIHEVWNKRIATAKLNRWLAAALETSPPPAVSGRRDQDPLHHAAKGAAALFRHLRQSAGAPARELSALSAEWPASDVRLARRAAAPVDQDEREPLRRTKTAELAFSSEVASGSRRRKCVKTKE